MERRKTRRKQGNTHISLAAIKQYLVHGTYPSGSTPSDKRSVRKRAESFKIEDGELHYVVRPKLIEGEEPDPDPGSKKVNLRKAILTQKNQLSVASLVHIQGGGTHMGTERTLSALSAKYYWVGMANTVRKVLKNCAVCLANRPAVATLPPPVPAQININQASEPEVTLPSSEDMLAEKREIYAKNDAAPVSSVSVVEDSPEGLQYIVTAELAKPEDVDSDLDFDPSCAVTNAVFNPRSDFETAQKFWQKVEVQVLGPFPYKKKRSVYVIASIDSFSKWPELQILEKVNEKTVSQFCLKLIARFGTMGQLVILENEVTAENSLDSGGISQNLQNYSIFVSKENVNIIDESWNRLVINTQRFINLYTETWFDCLDLCLIPLRNSLTRTTDFTSSFLVMGREPVFPDSIIGGKDSADSEVALTNEQIEQCTDTAMSFYLQCVIPDIKKVIPSSHGPDSVHESFSDMTPVRKSARKMKKYHRPASFGDRQNYESDNSDSNETTQNGNLSSRKRKSAGTSVLYKKTMQNTPAATQETQNGENEGAEDLNLANNEDKLSDELERIDLDTYYMIVDLYKREGKYPANSDPVFKRTVRKVAENFVLDDGELKYKQKGKLKKVLTHMEDRLALMEEAHIVNGEHMSRLKTLESVDSKNISWKGMHLDVRAYIGACSACRHGERRTRRKSSKKALKWLRGVEEEGDSDVEESLDGTGKVSYEDLIGFIKKDIIPDNLSRSELLSLRKKAKNFKLEKGVLYFCPVGRADAKSRKFLKTWKEKEEALKEAHGDQHLGHNAMKEVLRKSSFWPGMSNDIDNFLMSCCHPEKCRDENADEESKSSDPVFEEKLKQFQDHFSGMDICPKREPLDSLFPKKDEAPSQKTDLVAAAMESAKLPATNSVSSNGIASPEEPQPTSSNDRVEDFVVTEVLTPDSEQIQTIEPESGSHGASVVAHSGEDMAVPKLEILEERLKVEVLDRKADDTENKEEETMEGMLDDEIRNEDLKPQQPEMQSQPLPLLTVPVKKSLLRRRCEVCQEVVKGENNFKEHMYKHTKVKPFNCNLCHKKFTSIKGLKMHSRKHTGHRPYLCNICGRGFPRSASLRYHIKTHDKGGGVPVVCDVCNRTFTTENRMQKHKRFKHPAQAPVFMCEQCGKVFTAKRSLKRHEEAHQGIRKYECQYCKRSFFRKEYLNYHLVSHSNEDPSLANYKIKSKMKKGENQRKRDSAPSAMSIVCLDSATVEVPQDQEVYGQLVEVTDPQEWTEGERTMVYQLDNGQRVEAGADDHSVGEGTTVVVMEGGPDTQGGVEVRHYIVPGDLQQHTKPAQQLTIQRPQQQAQYQQENNKTQSIEVALPTGTHTFTLPSGNQLQATQSGQDTVQYQVECLAGETLTEADFNAIRMLAQASLSGQSLVQQ